MTQELIILENLTKRFNDITAVNNISLQVRKKQVLGFLGPNGAGKSTFIKILSGMYKKDSGKIYHKNKLVEINGPHESSEKLGISTVYQDLALVEVQNVGINIFLNIEPTRFGFLRICFWFAYLLIVLQAVVL